MTTPTAEKKPRPCSHPIILFENARKRMVCAHCGKRRTIVWEGNEIVKVGKWFKPKTPKKPS